MFVCKKVYPGQGKSKTSLGSKWSVGYYTPISNVWYEVDSFSYDSSNEITVRWQAYQLLNYLNGGNTYREL